MTPGLAPKYKIAALARFLRTCCRSSRLWTESQGARDGLASFFCRPALTETDAPEVWSEQAKILASSQYLFGLLGVNSTGLIALDFRGSLSFFSIVICGSIPLLYLLLTLVARKWKQTQDSKVFLSRGRALLFLLGIAWGLLVYELAGAKDAYQESLLTGIIVAVVSTPMMTSPISASLAFWIPSSILCFLAVMIRIRPFNPYMLLCFSGYLCFVWTGIVFLNRALLERSRNRIQLQNQNRTIRLLLEDYEESGYDWLWETDAQLRLKYFSPRLAQLVQKPSRLLLGMPFATLIGQGTWSGSDPPPLVRLMSERRAFRELELSVEPGGQRQEWLLTGRPVYDDMAQFQGYRGVGIDVTEIRNAERRVNHLATHDALTGLWNRQYLMESLSRILQRKSQCNHSRPGHRRGDVAALLLLDLDRFKEVNDRYGHAVGDALLIEVARRLSQCVRSVDLVARLGGDEFAIIADVASLPELSTLSQRIIVNVGESYEIQGICTRIGVSIGICFPVDGDHDLPSILHNADLALYQAKAEGRSTWRLYKPEMRQAHEEAANMQFDLAVAIEREEFRIEYQPIFDLMTLELVGTEALLRWRRAGATQIPPSEFLPIAERRGLLARIGEWVLLEACTAAAKWPTNASVSVNVSPSQLHNDFLRTIDNVLTRSGLPANRLELEITESALLESDEGLAMTLRELQLRGVRLALDDFGTGYSSLAYLANFRFDDLKIDASLVRNLETQPTKQMVVRAVARLASDLLIPITAEGVETMEQADWLKEQGIAKVQGFLYSRPLSEHALLETFWNSQVHLARRAHRAVISPCSQNASPAIIAKTAVCLTHPSSVSNG